VDEGEMAADTNPSPNADLERQKLILEIEEKKKGLTTKKPWWTVLVELLGAPAAVLALVVAFTTASGNLATKNKTVAETAQIQANLSTAQATNKLATDLSEKQKEGPQAFEQAAAQNADKIQMALLRLQQFEEQASRITVQTEMLKFVLLWILFSMVGLIFDVLRSGWNTAVSTLVYGINAWVSSPEQDSSLEDDGDNYKKRRKRMLKHRLNRFSPSLYLVLNPLPDILRWSIQLSIFATLLSPLFNEIAAFSNARGKSDELETGCLASPRGTQGSIVSVSTLGAVLRLAVPGQNLWRGRSAHLDRSWRQFF
jgi:hypothetical protein